MKKQELIQNHLGTEGDAELARLLNRITTFALREREIKTHLLNQMSDDENGTDADSESIASPSRDN